ncbi:MAG: hypothetical protein Q7J28_14660 [Caulobacter sp.]|nr:hypothetical protein [Caulobacter sp.]
MRGHRVIPPTADFMRVIDVKLGSTGSSLDGDIPSHRPLERRRP